MRAKLVNVAMVVVCLCAGAGPGIIGAQIGPSPGPVDYGPTITTNQGKLFACYSLIRQMIDEYNDQSTLANTDRDRYDGKFRAYTWGEFNARLGELLAERNRLKSAILAGTYDRDQWQRLVVNASIEELAIIEVDLFGDKAVESAKDTVATSPLLTELKAIDLDDLTPKLDNDPLEDWTTYTEYDEGSDVTVAENTITLTNANPRGDTYYVYDNKGSGHFSGNFEHRVESEMTSATSGCQFHLWELSEGFAGDTIDNAGYPYNMLYCTMSYAPPNVYYRIWEYYDETGYYDTYIRSGATTWDVRFYNTIGRASSTFTNYICEDNYYGESGSDLQDTLSIGLQSVVSYQYVYGVASYDTGSGSGYDLDGYVYNLDLQEGAGPTAVGYSFGYIMGG